MFEKEQSTFDAAKHDFEQALNAVFFVGAEATIKSGRGHIDGVIAKPAEGETIIFKSKKGFVRRKHYTEVFLVQLAEPKSTEETKDQMIRRLALKLVRTSNAMIGMLPKQEDPLCYAKLEEWMAACDELGDALFAGKDFTAVDAK